MIPPSVNLPSKATSVILDAIYDQASTGSIAVLGCQVVALLFYYCRYFTKGDDALQVIFDTLYYVNSGGIWIDFVQARPQMGISLGITLDKEENYTISASRSMDDASVSPTKITCKTAQNDSIIIRS